MEEHLRLIWFFLNRYRLPEETLMTKDDLFTECWLALREASEKYDPSRGGFATLAFYYMRCRCRRAVLEHLRHIDLPSRVAEDYGQPVRFPVSLDAPPADEDEGVSLHDVLVDPRQPDPLDVVLEEERRQLVEQLLTYLTPEERALVEFRFGLYDGDPHSLAEIADAQGVARETVRKRLNRALEKLRQHLDLFGETC